MPAKGVDEGSQRTGLLTSYCSRKFRNKSEMLGPNSKVGASISSLICQKC